MKKAILFLLPCVVAFAAAPTLAASPTANELRLSSQEEELRALNGRLEEMEFSIHKLDTAMQRLQSDVEQRLKKIEAQIETTTPLEKGAAEGKTEGTLGVLKLRDGKVTDSVNQPSAPSLPPVSEGYGLTPQEQYERAFNFLREANYKEAQDAFRAFIDKNPNDKLLDNAKYWYAETLYVRARFEEAAVAFADAYQQNPKGAKAPDSLLKLGMSLEALKKTGDACVTFNELKNKYPNASPTIKTRAREERAKLKCPN
ncbi:MAG: tol-pal system protein YbgF [Alphaproteobacteria bacterium]|nr:tol-pal system protein YbgF [Alphaproteobacteria bacterium]